MAEVLQYSREFFVWIDETGSDNRDQIRKFGYPFRVYGFGGLERWNGMVEWTGLDWTGLEWNGRMQFCN